MMGVLNERTDIDKQAENKGSDTILDLSNGVIYFGTPTSAEKRLHAMETPPRHVSSRRKTVLLPSKTALLSIEHSDQQENSKEKKKNRRQSYLYATKSSVMMEQQLLMEIQNENNSELYSRNLIEENTLFMEAPGSVERKIKKKNNSRKLSLMLSSYQKRMKGLPRLSVLDTITPHSVSAISRRKSTSLLLQKQNKILYHTYKKNNEPFKTSTPFCIKIQAVIRGYLIRKSIIHQNQAAKIIQLRYLTMLTRRNFCIQRRSAIIIQSAWRGWVARIRYIQIVDACICIQKWWRELSQQRKIRQKDNTLALCKVGSTVNISNNSSLHGFLKKWESKKAQVAAAKNEDIKKQPSSGKYNSSLITDMKENLSPHLIRELSQKINTPAVSNESPKLSKKISKPKIPLPESKSAISMTLMLKKSISLSTARILSNPTNSLSSANTHNYHASFQNFSKLPKSRLAVPGFASKTTVLGDISPNSLRENTTETLNTPTRNIKVDSISTRALRISSPSPKKKNYIGSPPKKTMKKPVISRKTALLVPQNLKSLYSSQTVSENSPFKKNVNSFTNNGLGSPSRQKVVNQIDSFPPGNLETNNQERSFYSRPKTIDSKILSILTPQPSTLATRNNISHNLYTPRSLNYLTLGEITKMTRQNTYQNRIYRCDFDREYTHLKKGVKWDKLLEFEIGKSTSNSIPEKSNSEKKVYKGCLSKKTHMIQLDDLGNVLDARDPLTPIIGKAEKVIVQKFLYRGEEDE
ncbi:hypothetical protein PCK1_002114 [Pneumocystis canis]|nr:hypothetical protein PCK1_002114 [Pneumocystis canis]